MAASKPTIRDDLARLDSLLRWAHNDAYWRQTTRTGPTKPLSKVEQDKIDQNTDYVPSQRPRDIGIGSDHRRAAWNDAIVGKIDPRTTRREGGLITIELCSVAAVNAAGITLQPSPILPDPASSVYDTARCIDRIKLRLQLVKQCDHADDPHVQANLAQLARHLDAAIRVLDEAFAEGTATDHRGQLIVTACKNAGIGCPEPAASGRIRCYKCDRHWRKNHEERTSFIGATDTAREAARRRAERGEGWGEA